MEPVRAALYNSVFSIIVSVDEAGTVCTWDFSTGAREGRFVKAHGDSKVLYCTVLHRAACRASVFFTLRSLALVLPAALYVRTPYNMQALFT